MKLSPLLSVVFLIFASTAFAQTGTYTINGKIGKLTTPAQAYVSYRLGKTVVIDSAQIKNGSFHLKGKVTDPMKVSLVIDHKGVGLKKIRKPDFIELYVENAAFSVVSKDSIFRAKVSKSVINDEHKMLNDSLAPYFDLQKKIYAEYSVQRAKNNRQAMADLGLRMDKLDEAMNAVRSIFIKANPASFVSFDALKAIGGYDPDIAVIEPLFNGLSDKIKSSSAGKEYTANMAKMKLLSVGTIAPEFTQNNAENIPVSLSSFKGKYVLVDFWASWCGPCRGENPNVVVVYNQYKDKNFTVLGVSLDNDKDAWLKAIEKDGLTWTQVSDLKSWQNAVGQLYMIHSIPSNFLIDPTGKIIAKNLRGDELLKKMKELLE